MLSQTDAVKQAWAATDRTLDIIVTVDGKDYQATEINSLTYDAGAFTGDTLGIGSTYENSITIEFSSVVEAFKQGLTVLPKVGILVDGKFEYTSLGTFIIFEVNRDRNNNLTTIKALDQMCKLEGQYKPTVSDTASPLDIIADIANQGGVTVNTAELQHLPTLPNIKKIEGQTLRTAIGWVAQLYGGFAAFDRDGKLTIRTTASPDYTITPGEYQQGGLTKNEVAYKTGGIKVTVNIKKTDDSGQEVDDTTTLQAGETTGSQIELTNDSMTNDLLTTVWTGIKDITYYPYTLNWFGNPNLEAGDWVTLTDTQGNQFNVPVNQYTMSFNGGLESTISATQSSSTAGWYAYTGSAGSIKNMIEALQVRHTASGNNVYPPSYQGQPQNPKKGDVWYKQNGNNVEVWIYQEDNGTLSWVRTPIDGEVKADLEALGTKTNEDLTRVKSELSSEAETQWQSMKAATSAVASDLSATKDSLATVSNDLSATKTSLEDTRTSLSTTAAELRDKTGQLSGSLSTANSKIEFNSNAIAEVKHTAEEISTTVSNLHAGDRNYARNTSNEWTAFTGFTGTINYITPSLGVFYPDDLQVGDTVTIGYTIKNSGIQSGIFHIQAPGDSTGWNAGSIGLTQYDIAKVCPDGATTTLIEYRTLTADNLKNSSFDFQIRTDNFPAGTLSYRGLFVKKGNLATDWSPAPEDTDQAISKVSQTADAIRADLTNTRGDVSSLKATAGEIRTDLTNAKGDIASVKATADSLTTSMTNAQGDISTLQHTADSITTTLSQGGSNLLSGTSDFSWPLLNWWAISGSQNQSSQYNDSEKVTERKCIMTPGQIQGLFWGGNNTVGQTYTLSFDARCDNGKAKIWQMGLEGNLVVDASLTTDWTRYHVTVKVTASNQYWHWVTYFISADADNVYTRKYQIEYGETATPWKPSNGDISFLQQTAQGLTTRVSNTEGNISSLQETAKELKATVGDDTTGLVSYVKAIPGQISSAITASKQATVVTSAVDVHDMKTAGYYLLKGTLTNSPVDSWAFLRVIASDGGDRIYHQIWKDDASTVYTEEWTGSWSDWATHINSDNLKSNVITAINQSTEGVSITGSKVTLDGNVNVAPGFTLSADYIKAGKLSADRVSGGELNFSNITVKGLTANSISSGRISGQNLNINLDNGVVEFTKGNLHSTDGGFNISIDTKSFYLDMGNDTKLWINGNGFHLQESASQHLWMDKNGLHNYTDANKNGLWINDTTLKVLNSSNAGVVVKDGMLQFSANPTWNSDNVFNGTLNSQIYGTIGFNSNLLASSLNGIFIRGREGVVIGTSSYGGGSLLAADSFMDVGQAGSGINLPDDLNKPASIFTKSVLTLLGGPTYPGPFNMTEKAEISIGCDTYYTHSGAGMSSNGTGVCGNNTSIRGRNVNIRAYDWVNIESVNSRIALNGQYVHSYPTYNKTTSAGANVHVAQDGALVRSSSARKYKTDIQDADNDYGNKLIEFAPQKWIDKAEKKRYEEDPDNNKKPGYYYGLIADDLDAAGLDMLVNYGAEGEVEGINYDRLAVALLPVIKSLKDQVASLKEQLKALTK
jgi:methyl-accepting chemotaxis protein|uniref:Minor structural protein 4 n=1 Tax=Myoviridae sp. ctfWc3 TaxID=2827697 RepID=A0A8S5SCY0_9CAUD|nr:MAG TPA: Minor structural protein 4 [Myoviridae sp. ctfWc3]